MKFRQLWSPASISIPIKLENKKREDGMIMSLNYIGQEFVRNARIGGNYDNWTGNLRSSIGYAIYKDGRNINSVFEPSEGDKNGEGVSKAKQLADDVVKNQKGLVLIVTAGMDYALAVESYEKTVLTAFAPSESKVLADLKILMKYV